MIVAKEELYHHIDGATAKNHRSYYRIKGGPKCKSYDNTKNIMGLDPFYTTFTAQKQCTADHQECRHRPSDTSIVKIECIPGNAPCVNIRPVPRCHMQYNNRNRCQYSYIIQIYCPFFFHLSLSPLNHAPLFPI